MSKHLGKKKEEVKRPEVIDLKVGDWNHPDSDLMKEVMKEYGVTNESLDRIVETYRANLDKTPPPLSEGEVSVMKQEFDKVGIDRKKRDGK